MEIIPGQMDLWTRNFFFNSLQEGADRKLLWSVEVEIVDRKACEKVYDSRNKITPRCASVPKGGKDSCLGDSGGTLVNKKSGKQTGIVSWGTVCALKKFPGVFSNVV